MIRVWLGFEFERYRWYGPMVGWVYRKFGERVAAAIGKPKNWRWREAFTELFDCAKDQAEAWSKTEYGARILAEYGPALTQKPVSLKELREANQTSAKAVI